AQVAPVQRAERPLAERRVRAPHPARAVQAEERRRGHGLRSELLVPEDVQHARGAAEPVHLGGRQPRREAVEHRSGAPATWTRYTPVASGGSDRAVAAPAVTSAIARTATPVTANTLRRMPSRIQ